MDKIMDMVIANIFKHNVNFHLVSEEPDYEELRFYSVGRQYSSRKIENIESIGVRDWVDLCLYRLQEFFVHIVSTVVPECPVPIDHTEIKARIRLAGEAYGEHDLVGCTLDNPRNNIHLFTKCSVPKIYAFPEEWLNEPFYIDVEAYFYVSPKKIRKLATWELLGFLK